MTRLEKYLLATASEIIEAETTESRYFVIGNIKLRVSDHYSSTTDADLQVIIPYNGGSTYMVTLKGSSGRILHWNAKQIKEFIPAFQIMTGMRNPISRSERLKKEPVITKIQSALSEPNLEDTPELTFKGLIKSRLNPKKLGAVQRKVLIKTKSTWDRSEIDAVRQMLGKELSTNAIINEDVQIFLTCTSVTYEELLNIYKIIVIDSKLTPTIKLLQKAYTLTSVG